MSTHGRDPVRRKLLFLSGLQVYPTLSGGNLRSFALANALQRHGLEVFVYSMVGRKKDYLRRRPSSMTSPKAGGPPHQGQPPGFQIPSGRALAGSK